MKKLILLTVCFFAQSLIAEYRLIIYNGSAESVDVTVSTGFDEQTVPISREDNAKFRSTVPIQTIAYLNEIHTISYLEEGTTKVYFIDVEGKLVEGISKGTIFYPINHDEL